MAVGTPTDHLKSVRNNCVIEVVLSCVCFFFCWYMGFCHRTESDLALLFSLDFNINILYSCIITNFNLNYYLLVLHRVWRVISFLRLVNIYLYYNSSVEKYK